VQRFGFANFYAIIFSEWSKTYCELPVRGKSFCNEGLWLNVGLITEADLKTKVDVAYC
jgi:hypothetical protein